MEMTPVPIFPIDLYSNGEKVKRLQARRSKLIDELTPLENEWARRAEE